jgi:predicted MPP superfamily phosphohydrolase
MIQEFSPQQVQTFVNTFEAELLASPRHKIDLTTQWSKHLDKCAGVYFIFDNNVLVYIGETANLYKRMKEIGRTYNHSFRKKLGRKLQPDAKIERGKYVYDTELETLLTAYCNTNISVACKPLAFGRLEVESYLIHKYTKIDKKQGIKNLLNSAGKRNSIPIFKD